MTLNVNHLSYYHGKKCALDSLSFSLSPGLTLLLGPNGAGKSTLYSLLTGINRIQSGQIEFGELNLTQHRLKVMSQLGVVFQQSTLDLDLTIAQNLTYFASLQGISGEQGLANISDVLKALELEHRLNEKVRHLNGGHRRRVEIARCLIHSPRYLLLDEPTVGLDIGSRQIIMNFVRDWVQHRPLTVLWATHLLEEVHEHDPLILLSQGKLKGTGSCRSLMNQFNADSVGALFSHLTKVN